MGDAIKRLFLFSKGPAQLMPKNIRYIKSVKYMRTPLFSLLIKGGSIVMGYGGSCGEGCGFTGGFALLVVLFILLIIIGCTCFC